jgi:hypothetical protein
MIERALIDYGALGVFAVLSVAAIGAMWRALRHEQQAHRDSVRRFAEEIDRLQAKHQAQIEQVTERIIKTHETTTEKYHSLASAQGLLLEATARRIERR